jgi:hypothetical protein
VGLRCAAAQSGARDRRARVRAHCGVQRCPTSDDLASLETASTANIQEDTVGPITTKYFAPADDQTALSAFPARVQRLLAGLAKPIASSSLWGSGTVVRAS